MSYDPRTTAYIERRMNEDQLTRKEAVRCLKHDIAPEVFNLLPKDRLTA
jgi:hypothetical protein